MGFGPFALQWRRPQASACAVPPLPAGIRRTFVQTSDGALEMLSTTSRRCPGTSPLFFAHGGFGCAAMWIPYMLYFSSVGFTCYTMSYRGHGCSWYPSFFAMYFTSRGAIAQDLVKGIEEAERLESEDESSTKRPKDDRDPMQKAGAGDLVLVAHSAGGALSQYILSRGLVRVKGFCMLAAVPAFGSWSCYRFWSFRAPFQFPFRLFHPRYVLATTKQVHDAFFSSQTPITVVRSFERLLSPYESMCWPMQALFRFVDGPDVLRSITGWTARQRCARDSEVTSFSRSSTGVEKGHVWQRLLVVAAEHDVLCTPTILRDAAQRYQAALLRLITNGEIDGADPADLLDACSSRPTEVSRASPGVGFVVVKGLGHHLQNDVGWEAGAETLLEWMQSL